MSILAILSGFLQGGGVLAWVLSIGAAILAFLFGREKLQKNKLQKENTQLKDEKLATTERTNQAIVTENNRVNDAVKERTKVEDVKKAKPTPDKIREDDGYRRD